MPERGEGERGKKEKRRERGKDIYREKSLLWSENAGDKKKKERKKKNVPMTVLGGTSSSTLTENDHMDHIGASFTSPIDSWSVQVSLVYLQYACQ